jgi:hypothetical protein
MIVAVPIGTLVKLIATLVVALLVVLVLASNVATHDTPVHHDAPPAADIRANQ